MVRDRGRERAPRKISPAREQVFPQAPRKEERDYVQYAGQDDDPGRLKVQVTAPAVLVGEDVAVAGGDQRARGGNVEFEKRRGRVVAGFPPIEARVRDNEFGAGDEQSEKAERGNPVCDADEERMARSNR